MTDTDRSPEGPRRGLDGGRPAAPPSDRRALRAGVDGPSAPAPRPVDRRRFLGTVGGAFAAAALPACADDEEGRPAAALPRDDPRWEEIRAAFSLDPAWIHMAGLLIASHPRRVSETIAEHRRSLDRNPALYVEDHFANGEAEARAAAADYLGVDDADVALTDSTTMGIGLIYGGIAVREGHEILSTDQDYHSTHDAIGYRAVSTGADVRHMRLHDGAATVSADELVGRVRGEIRPETRVLALTWVHSSTGLKLPAARIAEIVAEANRERAEADRLLFCLDGVHGLGVEDVDLPELGCDFFMAGTHKWLFGPRGTGIAWGRPEMQDAVAPTIPTFSRQPGWGPLLSPGGFKPFEHQWAMAEAFRLHQRIGRAAVAGRIHALSRQAKEGLAAMEHVHLHTPMDEALSAGIVCFEVDGMSPAAVVAGLRERGVIASTTPYDPSYPRITPGLLNTSGEVEHTLGAMRELG